MAIRRLTLPYPPLVFIQSDKSLTWDDLVQHINQRFDDGVSICLQTETGHEKRGGFFFHLQRTPKGYVFRTFDRQAVLTLGTEAEVVAFINHVSGRKYDEQMWSHAQVSGLRADQTAP